jgi:membrane-associated phospholipid phosphatase
VDPAPLDSADELRWRRIRRRVAWIYFALLVAIVILVGVPTDRFSLLLIILAGLGITCLGRTWRAFGRVLLDWLPFTLVLVVYDVSRGLATLVGLPLHESDVAAVDRTLFFGTVPTVWLQEHLLRPGSPQWYDALATLIYTSHFLATPIVAAVLWLRDRARWLAFITRVIALSLAGLITYVLFPAAPPWYAARDGVIGPAIRASARGWIWLHLNHAGNLLSEGQEAANPVAAIPSLHTAFATIIALFVAQRLHSRWRWLVALYPIAMGCALVYLGEHYVVDVVSGVIYALGVHFLVNLWERRRDRRRAGQSDSKPDSGADSGPDSGPDLTPPTTSAGVVTAD